jgi:hypothetical protein
MLTIRPRHLSRTFPGFALRDSAMTKRTSAWAAAIVCALAVSVAGSAHGDEHYYTIVFGSQSKPKLLTYTHTWATFIRVIGDGEDPNGYEVYQHTISWLPASLDVRTWALLPERGVNLDLYATLDVVAKKNEHVAMWGPFEILPQVYQRSLMVKAVLDSGAAQYRAISTPRNILISDCIHAVAAVDPIFGRGHYPLIRIGKPASRFIARQGMLRSDFDQYQTHAMWLVPRLGLDRYPIEVIPPQHIPKRNCFLCRCPE